jgi:iron-sulfur cluster assembly accessory protein
MNPIIITENACRAFLENLQTDHSENKYIRIAIKGGGCSGMQYFLDIAEKPEDDDVTWEQNGVKFVLDEFSKVFLEGMTIDYNFGLTNSGFQFLNPKSTRSCGCNKSFMI